MNNIKPVLYGKKGYEKTLIIMGFTCSICIIMLAIIQLTGILEKARISVENGFSSAENIEFTNFYRGFTPLPENSLFPSGTSILTVIITTESDWSAYMEKNCPGIPYFVPIDFSKESLITIASLGAKPTWNSSFEIELISVNNNDIDIIISNDVDESEVVFALSYNNLYQCFIYVVKVNKIDLPTVVNNISLNSENSSY